jgi:hypothetical protein
MKQIFNSLYIHGINKKKLSVAQLLEKTISIKTHPDIKQIFNSLYIHGINKKNYALLNCWRKVIK